MQIQLYCQRTKSAHEPIMDANAAMFINQQYFYLHNLSGDRHELFDRVLLVDEMR